MSIRDSSRSGVQISPGAFITWDRIKKMKTIAVSGGFDPVHIGHLRMFQNARALGDKLVVILNNYNWLKTKKGYVFMPESERAEILRGFSCVDDVFITNHEPNCSDMSVCSALRELRPDIFANGSDRKSDNVPEYSLCEELGIEMVFSVGGEKVQSSSEMVKQSKLNLH